MCIMYSKKIIKTVQNIMLHPDEVFTGVTMSFKRVAAG